jgi:hypothetical protein
MAASEVAPGFFDDGGGGRQTLDHPAISRDLPHPFVDITRRAPRRFIFTSKHIRNVTWLEWLAVPVAFCRSVLETAID